MAASTGFVVTAGALVLIDDLVNDKWETPKALRVSVATVLAAYVSAGIDKVIPGLGTGLSVVLVAGVVLSSGGRILNKIFGESQLGSAVGGAVRPAAIIQKAR
jgi:hypothetical protein